MAVHVREDAQGNFPRLGAYPGGRATPRRPLPLRRARPRPARQPQAAARRPSGCVRPAEGRRRRPSGRRLRLSGPRRLDLKPAKVIDGDVAAHEVPGLDLGERRLLLDADLAEESWAARVEDAAGGWIGRTRDLALETNPRPLLALEGGHGRQECLRVGMVRTAEDGRRVADLL